MPAASMKSTRAGDISSAICGSVSCPKNASERRSRARRDDTRARGWRRTTWSSPPRRCSGTKRAAAGADRLLGRGATGGIGEGDGGAEQAGEGPEDGGAGGHAANLQGPGAVNRRPRLELHGSTASPEEAAAVIAAIEQFLRDTAPPPAESHASPTRGCEPHSSKASTVPLVACPGSGVTGRHGGPIVPAGRFPSSPLVKGPRMRAASCVWNAAPARNLRSRVARSGP